LDGSVPSYTRSYAAICSVVVVPLGASIWSGEARGGSAGWLMHRGRCRKMSLRLHRQRRVKGWRGVNDTTVINILV
jgi:hypothetical protein